MYDPDVKEGEVARLLCDVCRVVIGPKEPFCQFPVWTAWKGAIGQGLSVCKGCAKRALTNIQPESILLSDIGEGDSEAP